LFHAGKKENKEPGVYRNNRRTIEMLAAYELETQYEARFPIHKIAEAKARQVIERNVYRSIQKALQSAR